MSHWPAFLKKASQATACQSSAICSPFCPVVLAKCMYFLLNPCLSHVSIDCFRLWSWLQSSWSSQFRGSSRNNAALCFHNFMVQFLRTSSLKGTTWTSFSLPLWFPALCVFREPLQHLGRAGPSPFHRGRWAHHHAALPGAQAQQAHDLRRVPQLRQVGDRAHRHHHEAQAGWRPVWRGVWRSLEEVQPHSGCENS